MTIKSFAPMALLAGLFLAGCKGEHKDPIQVIQKLGGKFDTKDNDPKKPVVMVDLRNTAVVDEQLQCLKELPELQILILDSTAITDAGLESIKSCTQLQRIFLRNTRITAAAVDDLRKTFPKAEIKN
jgi:hypothetical protein